MQIVVRPVIPVHIHSKLSIGILGRLYIEDGWFAFEAYQEIDSTIQFVAAVQGYTVVVSKRIFTEYSPEMSFRRRRTRIGLTGFMGDFTTSGTTPFIRDSLGITDVTGVQRDSYRHATEVVRVHTQEPDLNLCHPYFDVGQLGMAQTPNASWGG
jgi:hypothetical protein